MTLPNDLMNKPKMGSIDQARKFFSPDKIKTLTKSQLQLYIQRFFEKFDSNFNLLQAVSPRFVNYNIDKSFDPATDPTQRKVQIARFFNELRGIVPCVLIVDAGINPDPQTIGLVAEARNIDGYWSGTFPVTRWIPITILAGARDLEEADDFASLISLMFNELRNLAGGNFITGSQENGDAWGIYLPNGGVAVSAPIEIPIADDPTNRIWYVQATLENVYFETSFTVKQKLPTFTALEPILNMAVPQINENIPVINQLLGLAYDPKRPVQVADLYKPEIIVPDTISVNQQYAVMINNFQPHFKVFVSDPNIATITQNWVLTPRQPGTFSIRIIDGSKSTGQVIITEKSIRVTL